MIFEQYTYKVKFKVLLIIFCMLSFAAYKRSFSTLIDVISENRILNKKLVAENKQTDINKLYSEIESLDKIIGKETDDKEKIQQNIISFVTSNSNTKASIFELKSIHHFFDENYNIYTNQLNITGNTNDLLSIAYDFEKKANYTKLVSLDFYTIKKNNSSEILHLNMIFQNYENNK